MALGRDVVLLLAAALAPADVCDDCRPKRLCRPHADFEAEELRRLEPALRSDDPGTRVEALRDVADLASYHENAPGKEAAAVLAEALRADPSLRVRSRAARLLTSGQHPETAVTAVVERLDEFRKYMATLAPHLTGRNEERGTVADAMDHLETVMEVAGRLRDDRVADALAAVLLAMPWEMYGQPVAMAATESLLDFGTRDAVEAVVRQLRDSYSDEGRRNVHDALARFAARLELGDAPEPGPDAARAWERWVKAHARRLPKELGRWEGESAGDG